MKSFIKPSGFLGIVLLVYAMYPVSVQAATRPLQVEVNGSLFDIQAEEAPLRDILTALSAKTGLGVYGTAQITQTVTCNFTSLTIEEGIKKLLKNFDYAFIFSKTRDGKIAPTKLWILGKTGSNFTQEPIASSLNTNSAILQGDSVIPDGRTNIHRKEWLANEVRDVGRLSSQFSTIPSGTQTEEKGIIVTRVQTNSVLQKIGISQGDMVSRVNGRPIETQDEFIRAIKSASQDSSATMMIERQKSDGRIDPVYVHFD